MIQKDSKTSKSLLGLSPQELSLIAVTIIWGVTFVFLHEAMLYSGPLYIVGIRFLSAGVIGLMFFWRLMPGLTAFELKAGVVIGLAIFIGISLMTYGLKFISASQSAFITAMYVPIVPLMQWVFLRSRPSLTAWLGIALAFSGMLLLTSPNIKATYGFGELLTLGGAVGIASVIILIGHYANQVNAQRVTVVQLMTAGILSFLLMPITGEHIPTLEPKIFAIPLVIGFATVLIQLTMNWAQQTLSPTRATLIYSSEAVWAGIASWIAGEQIGLFAIFGAGLILSGVLISHLKASASET
jgi:drug/metabolite transporter (DMT)-like permease